MMLLHEYNSGNFLFALISHGSSPGFALFLVLQIDLVLSVNFTYALLIDDLVIH